MLMLSKRHLDPCDCLSLVSGKKFREVKILWSFLFLRSFPKLVMHFFFWTVYNCSFGIKLLEEKIVNNLSHNLCIFIFLTPDDIVLPE